MILGKDLRVGDIVYGRQILALRPYTVPATVLIDSVAERHPEGLPAWLAELGPSRTQGPCGITLFHGEYYPVGGR